MPDDDEYTRALAAETRGHITVGLDVATQPDKCVLMIGGRRYDISERRQQHGAEAARLAREFRALIEQHRIKTEDETP